MTLVDDIIRSLTAEDYDRACVAWRDHMASFDWCLDTGRFGSVGEPGVSDLDCAALVRDGHHKTAIESHMAWLAAQPLERQYLFPHEPLFITEAARPFVPLLHTVHDLRWDRGIGPDTSTISAESRLFAHLAYALWLVPECARRMERRGELSLRFVLLLLKSLHVSEGFLASIGGDVMRSGEAPARSRWLRREIMSRTIAGAHITDTVRREFQASIARIAPRLDAYGERLSASAGETLQPTSGTPPFRLTRLYGKVTAAPRTIISASEDMSTLHHNLFALTFGLLPRSTPLGKAAAAFWDAARRNKELQQEERLEEERYIPRPFYYQPGVDDADLEDQEFMCVAMPAAMPHTEHGGGRVSTGVAGHLVHGPYVRIRTGARYRAELSYLAGPCPASRAGALDISVSRLDPEGNHVQFETLGFADLPFTGGAPGTARIEFDATQHSGALLETRVFAEAGTELTAFRIRISRIGSKGRSEPRDLHRRDVPCPAS